MIQTVLGSLSTEFRVKVLAGLNVRQSCLVYSLTRRTRERLEERLISMDLLVALRLLTEDIANCNGHFSGFEVVYQINFVAT